MKQAKVLPVEKVWLSSKELQAYLGMGKDFVDSLRESGRLRYYKIGARAVFYRKSDVDRLIEKGRQI